VKGTGRFPSGRRTARGRRSARGRGSWAVLCLVAVSALGGCARHVPVADLADEGARVGVMVTFRDGRTVPGRLLSLEDGRLDAELRYTLAGGVELRGAGEELTLVVDGQDVAAEIVSVEREGGSRIAVARQVVDLSLVSRVTFHRNATESSLGPILSVIVGPIIGAALAAIF
jgi:hypothetical protein